MKRVHPYVSIKLETMITTSLQNLNLFSAAMKLFMQYNVALLSLILTEWLFQWVLSKEHCEQTAVLASSAEQASQIAKRYRCVVFLLYKLIIYCFTGIFVQKY